MGPIEITLIVASVLIVVGVFGTMIYKKAKGQPTCDCGCGGSKGKKLLKKYHKKYPKEKQDSCCCCHCHDNDDENASLSSCCCKDKDEQSK